MKYTVVIQQPVQEEVRADLEQQLMQGLGLSASAANKLATRRSGRLLKPTTRAKAEKLQGIFAGVGAVVILEEVLDGDSEAGSGAIGGAAEPAAKLSTSASKPAGGSPDVFAAADPFAALTTPKTATATSDPFGADPFGADPFGTDPFGADPFAGGSTSTQVFSAAGGGVSSASAQAPAAKVDKVDKAETASSSSAGDDEWASFSQGLVASDTAPAAQEEDVWADFADTLRVDVPVQQRQEAAPAPLMPSFMDVADEAPAPVTVQGPRRSLEQQLLQSSLVPTGALALVTLLLLGLLLPASERGRAEASAQSLAHSLGTSLVLSDEVKLQRQLKTLVADDGIGFVQVKRPDGSVVFATDAGGEPSAANVVASDKAASGKAASDVAASATADAAGDEEVEKAIPGAVSELAREAFQKDYEKWQGENTGFFRRGTETYAVGEAASPVHKMQVAVGVPYRYNPLGVLLPWFLTSLLLLGLAAVWARRAAQALLGPIQRLVKSADAISEGDLTKPVHAEANDEVGDLAEALERMRLSLSAAMDRLRRRKR